GKEEASFAGVVSPQRSRQWQAPLVGAASAASSCSLPCEGRGRSDALASHWLAHRGATASCAGGPDGLGRGAFGISPNRGHPLPTSPCRRRGRSQKQLAAEAAPTRAMK